MRRVLPTLGLTAAGLVLILNFDTRSATSIALSGTATISTVAGSTRTTAGDSPATSSATGSNNSTNSTNSSPAGGERAEIMSQLPDWVIQRIDDQFPDGIPLDLLEQVAFQLGIQFDPTGSTSTSASGPIGSAAAGSAPSPSTTLSPTAEVVDGPTANTPFGPYQVEVTIDGDRITNVSFIRTPRDMQSMSIVRYALPRLSDQTLANQSGDVQFISGATYTSYAYQKSLQAALDAAGF